MKQVPLTTVFDGIFWLNVVALAIMLLTIILMPNVDFNDAGITGRSFLGFCMGAFFACPWLPLRPKGTTRSPIGSVESYIRMGGVVAGCIQSLR